MNQQVGSPTPLEAAAAAAECLDWSGAADILSNAGISTPVLDKRSFYLSRAKRYSEALELLAILRERDPDDFMPFYLTAYQYYVQELYSEAVPWFDQALSRHPDHIKANWRRAKALASIGRHADAREAAAKVLRLYHSLPLVDRPQQQQSLARASHMLGKYELEKGRGHDALAFLEQAVDADGSDPYHHYLLGKARLRTGNTADAMASLRRAQALKHDDPSIELELAACMLKSGDNEGCATRVARVESRCRGWMAFKGGKLALECGRPDLAVRMLEQASRNRDTKGDASVKELLEAARAAQPVPPSSTEGAANVAFGQVAVVDPDRGFGFLVDELGTRRHFKLRTRTLRKGDRVQFQPTDAPKGPAADGVSRV